MIRRTSFAIACCAVLLAVGSAAAGDWPHWRGPERNDVVDEPSHWEAGAWPPREPAWETNVGIGASSPVVVAGRVYVLGYEDGRDRLECLDAASGRRLWQASYPSREYGRLAMGDEGLYAGVTSTPEFDPETGRLYTLGIDGDLNAWDTARGGRKLWGLNLHDRFHIQRRERIGRSGHRDYGHTGSPLVHGDWLLVEAGADEGNLVAFDKRTGRPRWASESKDKAGHTGGPVPIEVEGVPCAAVLTLHHLLVVRLDAGQEGRTVAEFPWTTEFANNVATPSVRDDCVLVTSGYNHRAICKLRITLRGAEKLWEQKVCSKVCSPVIYRGHVYWAWERPYCLDWDTGRVCWTGPGGFGDAGSCIVTSDGRLILWADRGDLVLAETADRSPDRYTELARTETLCRTDVWPHVVLADGRLFCKDRRGNLKCFVLAHRRRPPPAGG